MFMDPMELVFIVFVNYEFRPSRYFREVTFVFHPLCRR